MSESLFSAELFTDLVGVPFVEGGRDPMTGLDCMGSSLIVLYRMGIEAKDPWIDMAERWRAGLISSFPSGWVEATGPVAPGDLLQTSDPDFVRHVSAVIGGGLVVQTARAYGTRILPLSRLLPHVVKRWRWKG